MERHGEAVLGARALNRATLARQSLLERRSMPAAEMIEHLVGMQAQIPTNPYLALWARLDGFHHEELGALITQREAVRATVMRATIHLVTAPDYRAIRALMAPKLEQMFHTGSPFGRRLRGADIAQVVVAGRELLAARPLTTAQLGAGLHGRFPDYDATALAYAVQLLVPLVQIAPRGVWGASLQPTWALAQEWLGEDLDEDASIDELALRYLAAFGPASAMDMQAWSGLTRLKAVFERLRPRLLTFRDESGRELVDLPDAPRPDPATPAPPRFLPEYDNVLLGHADRSRFSANGDRFVLDIDQAFWSMFLVDGCVAGTWKLLRERGSVTLAIRPGGPLSRADRAAVEDEAGRLLGLVAADAGSRDVRFAPTG